ncbi:hypothetical protein C0J26_29025 [Pseudomonas baetica]|nr:hypothetical protein C0J26_29025 [Pseudomonas baetica]
MGASLLAKADVHSTLMLTDTPYSRAGSLPQLFWGVCGISGGRRLRRSAPVPPTTPVPDCSC